LPTSSSARAGITALIVHYDDPALTLACLASLRGFDEVVVVDHPPRRLADATPTLPEQVRLVSPAANLGFAGGCNAGMAAVRTDFAFIVNNDATVAADAAARLRAAVAACDDDVAVFCPKILASGSGRIQSVAGLTFSADGIGMPRGFDEPDDGRLEAISECAAPSGAAFLVRADCWREVGGMVERFFCYCEDGDLGLRLAAAGYRSLSLPGVVVHHDLSRSTSVYSLEKAYLVERNRIWTVVHTAPLSRLFGLPFTTLWRLGVMAVDALRGRGAGGAMGKAASPAALLATLLRAWRDALAGIGPAFELRRRSLAPAGSGRRVAALLARHRATVATLTRSRD
jgi:N-acetylglucosaminyl-diphospho-decaprenol L-rhamnosyltransferase